MLMSLFIALWLVFGAVMAVVYASSRVDYNNRFKNGFQRHDKFVFAFSGRLYL